MFSPLLTRPSALLLGILDSLEVRTPNGSWRVLAPMPAKRAHVEACSVGSKIFVFGGREDDDIGLETHDTGFVYDCDADAWR